MPELPQHLVCPINDDLMEEPVVLSSGFTYEKSTILKHFEVNGRIDPLTREDVGETCIENKSIKHATEEFLKSQPWGYEFIPGEKIHSIIM